MSSLLPDYLRPAFHGFLHEIRNPMSAVLTASTLLADSDLLDDSDLSGLLKVVEEETRRMNRVVNEFDRYLHVPASVKEVFDLAALVRTIIDDLRANDILDKRVRVTDELPNQMMVDGDSAQIGEAIREVLLNAAQALQESSHSPLILALCPEESSSHVVFLIHDSGGGFTKEAKERAFEPFFSSRLSLTGLGLPMALALIENNDGKLEIVPSEKPGEGACLRVTLNR